MNRARSQQVGRRALSVPFLEGAIKASDSDSRLRHRSWTPWTGVISIPRRRPRLRDARGSFVERVNSWLTRDWRGFSPGIIDAGLQQVQDRRGGGWESSAGIYNKCKIGEGFGRR